MSPNDNDPVVLALAALTATIGDERRAQRFIALTGIGTEVLRERVAEPALLAEVMRFLEAHEPDLLSVAAALGVEPSKLVEARRKLEEGKT